MGVIKNLLFLGALLVFSSLVGCGGAGIEEGAASDTNSSGGGSGSGGGSDESSVTSTNAGASYYLDQCAVCHGTDGSGGSSSVRLDSLSMDFDTLSAVIRVSMPTVDASLCAGECADETANYILAGFTVTDTSGDDSSGGDSSGGDSQQGGGDSGGDSGSDAGSSGGDSGSGGDEACITNDEFFETRIQNVILTDCVSCHVSDGVAGSTDYELVPTSNSSYLTINNQNLETFAALTGQKDGRALLLSKPLGTSHGGGQRLSMTTSSQEYLDLEAMLDRYDDPITSCGDSGGEDETPVEFFSSVTFSSDLETLRKAALLFAGRKPTAMEETTVSVGDATTLRQTIRGYMNGTNFESFIKESANDHFLTNKWANDSTPAFNLLGGTNEYPDGWTRVDAIRDAEGEEAFGYAWWRTSQAIAHEPLELVAHVVSEERPYSEILTADYIMVTHWSDSAYTANATFNNVDDDDEWQEGQATGYRLGDTPHAGILTSPTFLARYPSTATNRNRARARWVYQFFLGVDIEALAVRPTDPDALADTNNPTMNNANCTVCHQVHDPVAGAFQNWSDDGFYRIFDDDSLPDTYKDSDLYTEGDLWFADMRSPGFNGTTMPSENDASGLQWLAQQVVADSRFGTGTVKFWFKAVFGMDPLDEPLNTEDSNFQTRLRAYQEQNTEIQRLADLFVNGTAGTALNGNHNLKDLLVEMVLSQLFRANGVTELDSDREDELAEVGIGRLITPEQLDRKFESLTGMPWARPWDATEHNLMNAYRTFYGGIDSDGITDRITQINTLMSTVVTRMANESACSITTVDFQRQTSSRYLFPLVEVTDLPTTVDGEADIRANIVYLHSHLLGEALTTDHTEVDATFDLFSTIYQRRVDQERNIWFGADEFETCIIDWDDPDRIQTDENQTIHAWMAVLIYLLGDYRFLYH